MMNKGRRRERGRGRGREREGRGSWGRGFSSACHGQHSILKFLLRRIMGVFGGFPQLVFAPFEPF
jgi:hypothetical protein